MAFHSAWPSRKPDKRRKAGSSRVRGHLLILPLAGIVLFSCAGDPPRPHAYVGSEACAKCHAGADANRVQETWQGTAHAKAWQNLGSLRGGEIAREMGVKGKAQQAPECLECHATGQTAPPALRALISVEEGVGCEACHGPGADYAKKLVMPEAREARRHGLRPDPEASCTGCHRVGFAHIKAFDYATRWSLIAHALPAKTGR